MVFLSTLRRKVGMVNSHIMHLPPNAVVQLTAVPRSMSDTTGQCRGRPLNRRRTRLWGRHTEWGHHGRRDRPRLPLAPDTITTVYERPSDSANLRTCRTLVALQITALTLLTGYISLTDLALTKSSWLPGRMLAIT